MTDQYSSLNSPRGSIEEPDPRRYQANTRTHLEVGEDEVLLDLLPDDAGHLVAIELHHGVLDLNALVRCI